MEDVLGLVLSERRQAAQSALLHCVPAVRSPAHMINVRLSHVL